MLLNIQISANEYVNANNKCNVLHGTDSMKVQVSINIQFNDNDSEYDAFVSSYRSTI